jgi:hypothetical protein
MKSDKGGWKHFGERSRVSSHSYKTALKSCETGSRSAF